MESGEGPSQRVHVEEGMDSGIGSSKRLRAIEAVESGVGPSKRLHVSEGMVCGVGPSKRLHVSEGMVCGVGPVTRAMGRAITDGIENYDVFLSHRGPDTKTGFVSFLYKDLVSAGIDPFFDCESIVVGEDSWECIERAIKNTPLALVIFSTDFAKSEWCLRELHVMLENSSNVKVLPIFYGVEPQDLHNLEYGRLAAGFETLKGLFSTAVIEQWRADLKDASRIGGWVHCGAGKRLEADLVGEVVGKVSELANKPLPLSVGEYVVGVQDVVKDIIRTLDGKKEVLMMVLWGMGGIGKSTLAREIYNQLSQKYRASCFVEDVRETVERSGVVEVQNRILKGLCKNKSLHIEDKSKGIAILERNLPRNQVLVVLDDISDHNEMMNHLITRKMLAKGSMCVVTTRDKRVIEQLPFFNLQNEILIHDVQVLSLDDSQQVFTSFAFGGVCNVIPGFEKMVRHISWACGGVPLVLKVCGALLKDEPSMDVWEDVMNRLKCGDITKEEKISSCLRISYDALKSNQDREIFLDIACALLGESQDVAMRVWKSQGWYPALGVRNLVKRALITLDGKGRFAMHDHLRDMGREIERRQKEHRRLWMPESLRLLEENEPLPNSLETLLVHEKPDVCYGYKGPPEIDCSLSHMKKLRILISSTSVINVISIPKNLLWLNWNSRLKIPGNSLHVLPEIPENDKLVILDVIFREWKIFPCKRNFLALEELCLWGCGIKELPNLQLLKHLYKLDISHSPIKEVPGLGDLVALVVFRAVFCDSLAVLPDMRKLTKLQVLDLLYSPLINEIPGLDGLMVLQEFFGKYEVLAPSSGLHSRMNLKKVCVEGWSGRGLPSVAEWIHLEDLRISWCTGATMLDGLLDLRKLQRLELSRSEFEDVSCLNDLIALKSICIHACEQLQNLPDMRNLTRLETLEVTYCFGLRGRAGVSGLRSPGILEVGQPSIETLRFDLVPLKELPDLSLFPQLRVLEIFRSKELERLISTVPIIAFEKLMLESCEKLKEVSDLSLFPQLKVLDIENCRELERLTSAMPMTALVRLELKSCEKLNNVPDLNLFTHLRDFAFYGCEVFLTFRETEELEAMFPGLQINKDI